VIKLSLSPGLGGKEVRLLPSPGKEGSKRIEGDSDSRGRDSLPREDGPCIGEEEDSPRPIGRGDYKEVISIKNKRNAYTT